MFFKPKQNPKEYIFILKNVIYSLDYPANKFMTQYETLSPILKSWINDEWNIIRSNLGIPIQNRLLVQLSKMVMRHIAKPEYREYLRKVSQDPNGYTTFSRFMDIVGLIHIACDPKFIDVLRIRFLKAHIDDVYGKMYHGEEPELLPTQEDWISCIEEFPWIWLIPHIQVLFYGDHNIQSEFTVLSQQQLRP